DGHKFRHHDSENACTRHVLHAHAGLLLDGPRSEPDDCRSLSDPHRDVRDAAARPLPRLPLLFGRRWRQRDDVREPVLDVGPPRSLHPRPAGIRHLLRGERDLLRQAAVRLPLDGRCDHGDLRHERWGRRAFWCWFIGFHLAFMPLYVTGLMGMTRRLQHYDVVSWQPWLLVAAAGVAVIFAGIACQVVQLVVSIRAREELRDVTGDPWNG